MSEAKQMHLYGTEEELKQIIETARGAGVTISLISEEADVTRSALSGFINNGTALSADRMSRLWEWANGYMAKRNSASEAALNARTYETKLKLFKTQSYTEGLGLCKFTQEQHGFAVVTGKPGTGKTTIVRKLNELLPHAVCIEAWPTMRMGDLIDDIADGIGVKAKGNLTKRIRTVERTLRGSDVTLVVDEAEFLRKFDDDKLEVLRKMWDHTGISLILVGTPHLLDTVNRMNTTQLSRRMWNIRLKGAKKSEVLRELQAYNIDPDAADALAGIAADTDHGGMGTYTMMMRLCLEFAKGDVITMDLVNEARTYKPGL